MNISTELKKLAEKVNKNGNILYIVGGYVRDFLYGRDPKDIDLASDLKADEIIDIATKLKFDCKIVNKKLGTVLIKTKNESWEYTPFRSESYSQGHTPDKIVFVHDLEIDAKRRDLTINAIYYNILTDEFVDPLGGKDDIVNGILRTANDPMITLKDDGLRILRIIRFASTLGFDVDKATLKALHTYKANLLDISKERILDEINKCVVADLVHYIPNDKFFTLLNTLDLYRYIFSHSLSRIRKPNKKDIDNFYKINRDSRLIAFYILVLKNMQIGYQKENQVQFLVNQVLGIDGIKESKENIRLVSLVYCIYQNLRHNKNPFMSTFQFLALSEQSKQIITNFLDLHHRKILIGNVCIVHSHRLPLSIEQLDINANDLKEIGIKDMYIGKILTTLFTQVIKMEIYNNREELLKSAKIINETFSDLKKTRSEK